MSRFAKSLDALAMCSANPNNDTSRAITRSNHVIPFYSLRSLALGAEKYPHVALFESETSKDLLRDFATGTCTMSMTQGLHFGKFLEEKNVGLSEGKSKYEIDICQVSERSER